jgi:hypothetical protein
MEVRVKEEEKKSYPDIIFKMFDYFCTPHPRAVI